MKSGRFKKYEVYKDSGVEWIGEIPEHWSVKRLKDTIIGCLSYCANESALDSNPLHPRYIRITDFSDDETLKIDTYKSLAPDIAKSYLLKEGDILLARSGATAGKTFHFKNYSGKACYAGYLIKARPKKSILSSSFFSYFTKSFVYGDWRNSILIKATIENISAEKYGFFLFIPTPSLKEQQAIANYLDTKTSQIDRKIDLLIQKASHYAKLRQSLINETVTQGLDKTVPMKDSGVEWIGEVPAHWEVKRLKETVIGGLSYGANESAVDSNPLHPRYIRITDFSDDETLKVETYKSLAPDIAKSYLLREGDILFARSGATAGKTFHFKNYSGAACYAGYLIKARPKKSILSSSFLSYFTKSFVYGDWRNSVVIKATIENISAEKYGFYLFIPIPPLSEQKAIADYLDEKTNHIDQIITTITTQIEKLKELRKTLINDVVTGKICVLKQEVTNDYD